MSTSACSNLSNPAPDTHPRLCRSEALGRQITELCGYINAATFRLLEMIREFDQEGLWQLDGLCSCAHWLNWQCGIGMNAAREKVRVANALGDLPRISGRFARGEISYSKVRALTRVATADNEDYPLMIARHGAAYHVETLVRRCRRVNRGQDDDTRTQHNERSLQVFYEPDGTLVLHARLPADKGALILKAIELAMDQDGQDVSAETSAASEKPEKEPFDQRRVDALADIAESYLAFGPTSSSAGDRYQVLLHVSAETLTGSSENKSPVEDHIEDGPHVSAETSIRGRIYFSISNRIDC